MKNLNRPIAVITGASAGIGEAYALLLAKERQYRLKIIARRADRLETLKKRIIDSSDCGQIEIETLAIDLADDGSRAKLVSDLKQQAGEIELLVNNAGFGIFSTFHLSDIQRNAGLIKLNCQVPVELSHALLPEFVRLKRGGIINVCSTAAFQPLPYMATYGASKAFLLSHTLAVAAETSQYNLRIMAHCPGPTVTEFHQVSGLSKKLNYLPAKSADKVVAEAWSAFLGGKRLVVNGQVNRFYSFLARHLPLTLSAKLVESRLRTDERRRLEKEVSTDS